MTRKKRVVIDAMAIGLPVCGLREYARQLCPRLIEQWPNDLRLTFLVPKGMSGCFGQGAEYIEIGKFMIRLLRRLPLVRADLFHTLHQLSRLKSFPGGRKRLMTIHDINFVHTKTGRKFQHARRRFLKRLRNATHLAYITKFAQADVDANFPSNLPARIIYNGVTDPSAYEPMRPEGVSSGPFLFHLSSLEPYKRAELLVEMMDSLPGHTLVIAGSCRNDQLVEMVAKRPNVVMLGPVSDGEKHWLYRNSDAFLFPSKAEGFGLPPVEAMLCGKPTFLANETSLPEIGGDAAEYWPEMLPDKMAEFLEERLANPKPAEQILANTARFSWKRCARQYIEYYKEILSGK